MNFDRTHSRTSTTSSEEVTYTFQGRQSPHSPPRGYVSYLADNQLPESDRTPMRRGNSANKSESLKLPYTQIVFTRQALCIPVIHNCSSIVMNRKHARTFLKEHVEVNTDSYFYYLMKICEYIVCHYQSCVQSFVIDMINETSCI